MKYRITIRRPEVWTAAKRAAVGMLWVVGGGALVAFVFAASFYLAMKGRMSSTEVRVPDLGGLTLEAASREVEPHDLVLQVVDRRNDPAVASDRVLQQEPPPGTSVRRGRKVKLILSLGGKVLQVPDLVGRASRAVAIELRQEGFITGEEAVTYSYDAPAGTVIAQVPPPDTPAVPNTRVHRLVSTGPPEANWVMPDLAGLDRKRAENWISLGGFRRGAVRRVTMSGRAPDTVVGQMPLAGYPIRSKEIVELTVAR